MKNDGNDAKYGKEFNFRQLFLEQYSCVARHKNNMLPVAIGQQLLSQWHCDTCCKTVVMCNTSYHPNKKTKEKGRTKIKGSIEATS